MFVSDALNTDRWFFKTVQRGFQTGINRCVPKVTKTKISIRQYEVRSMFQIIGYLFVYFKTRICTKTTYSVMLKLLQLALAAQRSLNRRSSSIDMIFKLNTRPDFPSTVMHCALDE